jgi:pimeloyl-ACP methyl ester carboxylesterase
MDCSFHGAAVRLLNFARKVGLGPFELLGTSHGGAVAMIAAALAPGSVRRLLLVAPVNPWSSHGRRRAAILSHPLMRPLLLRIAPHLRFAHSFFLRRVYQDSSRIPPGAVEGYSAPFALAGTFEHKLAMLASWNQDVSELRRILPIIANIPTLLLWGSKDPASLPVLSKQFRNCTSVVLDDVGHLPYEEVPQQFNAAIVRFLTAGFEEGTRR